MKRMENYWSWNCNMEKINWFWAHRRNSSLHHMSLIARGFHNNGFLPVVNFHFHNQIFVGKPTKGIYIFYDRDELNSKYKDIQGSINNNNNFPHDFKERSDQIFTDLFSICKKIKQKNLSTLSQEQLFELLKEFKKKITVAPLITVQLWGIEACWDEDYTLTKELRSHVSEEEFLLIKGKLSQSTGKSVALSEKESFLKVLLEIQKIPILFEKFKIATAEQITIFLNQFPFIEAKIKEHISNFEWVNSEYVSEKLEFSTWIDVFRKGLKDDAETSLNNVYKQHETALHEKQKVIEELALSEASRHIINSLNELVSERDWAKGKFCYALSVYDLLLQEIANRLHISKDDILYIDIEELLEILETKRIIFLNERKNGFALVSKKGNINIVTMELEKFLFDKGINDIFSSVTPVKSFKGVVASQGKVQGKVRVIDNPEQLSEFKKGEILVTYMTTMEFTPLFGMAVGIITDEGGLSSHAAIISREFGLPCIVGTNIATRTLKTGDFVELNATEGKITLLDDNKDL